MDNARGTRGVGERTLSHMVEEFIPDSGWTEDSEGNYLLVNLPGFKIEEVKLGVDNSGNITISGERKVSEEKCVYFDQRFQLPYNADMDNISGKFDGEILHVMFPKVITEENNGQNKDEKNKAKNSGEEEEGWKHGDTDEEMHGEDESHDSPSHNMKTENNHRDSGIASFPETYVRKWEKEPNIFENTMKLIGRNKGILMTALIAFSLGVLVSNKIKSAGVGYEKPSNLYLQTCNLP